MGETTRKPAFDVPFQSQWDRIGKRTVFLARDSSGMRLFVDYDTDSGTRQMYLLGHDELLKLAAAIQGDPTP